MPSTYYFIVDNPNVSAITGHHTIEVVIEEHQEDGTVVRGIVEKYGMGATEINQRFGGDVDKWLAWIGREMVAKHRARQGIHSELMNRRGQTIQIAE